MFCQASDPPVTVGKLGAVRSMRTVLPGPGLAGDQADALPSASSERNCTSVWPSADAVTEDPGAGADQVAPASVDSRYS